MNAEVLSARPVRVLAFSSTNTEAIRFATCCARPCSASRSIGTPSAESGRAAVRRGTTKQSARSAIVCAGERPTGNRVRERVFLPLADPQRFARDHLKSDSPASQRAAGPVNVLMLELKEALDPRPLLDGIADARLEPERLQPQAVRFERFVAAPRHRRVHVDAARQWRVHLAEQLFVLERSAECEGR